MIFSRKRNLRRWHGMMQFEFLASSFLLFIGPLLVSDHILGSCSCEASASAMTGAQAAINWTKRRQTFQTRMVENLQKITAGDVVRMGKKSLEVSNDLKIDNEEGVVDADEPIGLSGFRAEYADGEDIQKPIRYGEGPSFVFSRFQSPACIRKAFDSVRHSKSFRWFEGNDGHKGYYSSTKLGGNYVLAESEQIAIDCTTQDVLRAYLCGEMHRKWNPKKVERCSFTKIKKGPPKGGKNEKKFMKIMSQKSNGDSDMAEHNDFEEEGYFYRQDQTLRSQRVLSGHTGPMRYQQIIEIDKVGNSNYSVLVRLNKSDASSHGISTTAKKPFESLQVYVGLEQIKTDVKIYAAGVFEVNRAVVPKILVFDASGIAGALAGKGTLWLSALFGQRRKSSPGIDDERR